MDTSRHSVSYHLPLLYLLGFIAIPLGMIPAQVMNQLTRQLTGAAVEISAVLPMIAVFFVSSLGNALLSMTQTALTGIYTEHLVRNRSLDIFSRIMRVEPSFFRNLEPSKICVRIIGATSKVESFWLEVKLGAPMAVLGLMVFGFVLFCGLGPQTPVVGDFLSRQGFNQSGNWLLASLIFLLAPLQTVFLLFDKRVQKINHEASSADSDLEAISIEVISGVREVRNHLAFSYALSRIQVAYDRLRTVEVDMAKLQSIFSGISPTVDALGKCLTLAVGAYLCVGVIHLPLGLTVEQIGWNDFMGFSGMALVVNGYLRSISSYLFRWRMVKESISKLESFENKEAVFLLEADKPSVIPAEDDLILEQVSFATQDKITILDRINLTIRPGQHIAFVGPSGCGKSTAMNLLVRELEQSNGKILMGDKAIKGCNYASLAKEIGFVQQKPILFNMSLRENLLLSLRGPLSHPVGTMAKEYLEVLSGPEIEKKLIAVIKKVSLTTDIQRKAFDNPVAPPLIAVSLVKNAKAIRSKIQTAIQKNHTPLFRPYDVHAMISGASLLENLFYGVVRKKDDRQAFEKHIESLQEELFTLLRKEPILEKMLWLGLQLFRRDQSIAMQVRFKSAKLFEILSAYRKVESEADGLGDLQVKETDMRTLKPAYQKVLFDIAIQHRTAQDCLVDPPWLADFYEGVLALRKKLPSILNLHKWGIDGFDLEEPQGGVPLRNVLLGGQVDNSVRSAQEIIDKVILESLTESEQDDLILLGLEASAGIGGQALSGGQAMKVTLARILLKEPSILLLDEATAALDEKSQAQVVEMLDQEFAGKTVITISHRLSTIRNYDRIFVFDRGQIVQDGTWEELTKQEGLFTELIRQEKGESSPQIQSSPTSLLPGSSGEVQRALALSPVFSDLRSEALVLIERVATVVTAPAGAVLFERGDDGDEFFIILAGEVDFFVGKDNEEKIIDHFYPGQSFGELALFGEVKRTLGARAKTELRLCVLARESIEQLLEIEPRIGSALLKNAARTIAGLREEMYGKK